MKKYLTGEYFGVVLPYVIYAVVIFVLFWLSKYTLHSDGVSVMNIGQKWQAGHFFDAINSLWPPMTSALLGLFFYLPVHGVQSARQVIDFKILQMLLGLLTIYLSDLTIRNWIKNPWVRASVLTGVGLFITAYALRDTTDDLTACVATLLYAWVITKDRFLTRKWDGVIIGVVWAVGYFSRTYLLFFIAASLAFVFIYRWFLDKEKPARKMLVRNGLIAIGVFLVVSSPWVIGLHAKFHEWTFGISGSLNYDKYDNDAVGEPLQAMFTGQTLIPPTGPNDQSMLTELWPNQPLPWSPFQSLHAFEYQVLKIWKSIKNLFTGITAMDTIGIFAEFSPLLAGTIFLFALYILSKPKWYEETKNIILLSIWLIYPLGYIIIEVNDRYFYISGVIGLLLGGYLLEQLIPAHKKKLLIAAVMFFALTFVPFTMMKDLIAGYSFYYNRYSDGLYIQSELPTAGKRTATLGEDDSKTFRIAYFAGIPYYWRLDPTVPISTVISQLCEYKIDYPIIDNDSQNPAVEARYLALKKYYSGELQLQAYPELSVLYNAHLPCWTAPTVTAATTTGAADTTTMTAE